MNNYFALFGLPENYGVDLQDLSRRYRDLQKAVHPDRYATASESEKSLAVQRAAELNDAFQTLKDPVLRAKYLWQRLGGHWQDEKTIRDTQFLMQQMEWRERIGEAETCRDLEALQSLADELKNEQLRQQKALDLMFAELVLVNLEYARSEIQKLMFYRKLQSEALGCLQALEES